MNKLYCLFIFLILSTNILQGDEPLSDLTVEKIEHFWIPLKDGTKLAAKMWLPKDAANHPVPGILEYIPYGKRYGTRGRDEPMHHWFASHGYAAIRVDMRGSGESEGLLNDEYLKLEQDDALEVIDWISKQSWCSGSVGMMGKSWGGFNALQVAARRPETLKAIITVCSTDDRYSDDIHYMGGCLLNDNLWWGGIMLAYQSQPADIQLTGANGRQQWINRIEQMPFWPALWLKHQNRDDYWKQGSVCEDWSAIQCPVLAIGGWVDAYTNAVPRLMENLQVPRLGIIGPWAHIYPHDGFPGPAIGFLQEACRWWDHWLKGIDTKIMNEPMLRAYIEEWTPTTGSCEQSPGHWVAEKQWPSNQIKQQSFYLTTEGLSSDATSGEYTEQSICSPLWTGAAVGEWMGTGVPGELPTDQQIDDVNSLVFDTQPLTERFELFGAPELILKIASDKPIAQICARLCDLAPDGTSKRISYQVLNLTHRDSHETPQPLEPGQFYEVHIKLNDCGYAYDVGHRIRIALSSAYWPLIWPSPSAATLTISTKESSLLLPVRTPCAEDAQVCFELPAHGPFIPISQIDKGMMVRTHQLDSTNQTATYITDAKGGIFGEGILRFDDIDITVSHNLKRELTINKDDPLTANFVLTQTYSVGRPDWDIRVESWVKMTSTESDFLLTGSLKVFENGKECAQKAYEETIPRDNL
jgi:putative CocE/NonD family hydrolase